MIGYQMVLTGMLFSLLIVVCLVLFYVRYKRRIAKQELALSRTETDHQRELLQAVILSQEKERRRIGMNLHDEVGTALSILRMAIDSDATQAREVAGQSKALIDRVLTDVRNISHDLSPIRSGAYTFTDAVEDRCEAIAATGKVQIDLEFVPCAESIALGETESLAMYRVISELISNTLRHAGAQHISIRLSVKGDTLSVLYRDDGKGIHPEAHNGKGMGMQNIESRLNMIGAAFKIIHSRKGFCFLIEYSNTQFKTA